MRIGGLAARTGIPPQTIRFYERRGLLPAADRRPNGYRDYREADAARLAFIRSAQAAGLTLAEIEGVLRVRQAGQAPCGHVSGLLARKLDDVHARQRELALLEAELQQLVEAGDRLDPADCTADDFCHILSRRGSPPGAAERDRPDQQRRSRASAPGPA
jgi:DNA-binding transcriptional MerR regulator